MHFVVTGKVRDVQFSLYIHLCVYWKTFFLSKKIILLVIQIPSLQSFWLVCCCFGLVLLTIRTSNFSVCQLLLYIMSRGIFMWPSIPLSSCCIPCNTCLYCFTLKQQNNSYLISPLSVCRSQLLSQTTNSLYWFRKRKITLISSAALLWLMASLYWK